ncbi:MAG: HD domain-containing protein [Planctomycetes bacterium]|nr:HD domain-containing protein [Planctomycetota bacterium]
MVRDYTTESLSHDPIHGYIPFISRSGLPEGEVSEQEIIDHPWVQRMRQIHQLQTAWWVFPTAEHTRFQHILGVMHLASLAIEHWYESLCDSCRNVPSRAYVESLVRMAGLLHDVGHGPFGHFFDDHYLDQFGVTHEDLGAAIIKQELGELLRRVRRNPNGKLGPLEELDPAQIGWLIRRPSRKEGTEQGHPDWLVKLRSLFSGIYTVDNMDFVLRDAYMSGYNVKAFDLFRLLHYSFFMPEGLTIHARGLRALINFIEVRANLFRTIYFHRTVRGLDVALAELFPETMPQLLSGNPLEHLDEYQRFTEASFLVDVQRFGLSPDPQVQELGRQWQDLLSRKVIWKMAAERALYFQSGQSEQTTIFSEPDVVVKRVRRKLPKECRDVDLRVDIARHYHRPSTRLPSGGQNFVFDPADGSPRELSDYELFRELPLSFSICRIYARDHAHDEAIQKALSSVLGDVSDAKTNM